MESIKTTLERTGWIPTAPQRQSSVDMNVTLTLHVVARHLLLLRDQPECHTEQYLQPD